MHPHERFLLGFAALLSAVSSGVGAIFTVGDERWVFITFSVSALCSAFLSLVCRKDEESARVVVGRCCMSVLLTIFGSRFIAWYYHFTDVNDDLLLLGGLATVVCIGSYFIGHGLILALNSDSVNLGKSALRLLLGLLRLPATPPDDPKK